MSVQPDEDFDGGSGAFDSVGLFEDQSTGGSGNSGGELTFHKYSKNAPYYYRDPEYFIRKGTIDWMTAARYPQARGDAYERAVAENNIANRLNEQQRKGLDPAAYLQDLLDMNPDMSPGLAASLALADVAPTGAIMDADQNINVKDPAKMVASQPGSAAQQQQLFVQEDHNATSFQDPQTGAWHQLPAGGFVRTGINGQTQAFNANGDQIVDASGLPTIDPNTGNLYNVHKAFKWGVRNAFAALQLPIEGLTGAARGVFGSLSKGDVLEAGQYAADLLVVPTVIEDALSGGNSDRINTWEQTTMGQTILQGLYGDQGMAEDRTSNFVGAGNMAVDQGQGFSVSPMSEVGRAQRAAAFDTYAVGGGRRLPDGTIPNEAWTFGRGFASALGLSGDESAYRTASGVIDFAVALFADPVNYVPIAGPTKALGNLSRGRITFQAARNARGLNKANIVRSEETFADLSAQLEKAQGAEAGIAGQIDMLDSKFAEREAMGQEILRLRAKEAEYSWMDEVAASTSQIADAQRVAAEHDAFLYAGGAIQDLPAHMASLNRARSMYAARVRYAERPRPEGVKPANLEELDPLFVDLTRRYQPNELLNQATALSSTLPDGLRTFEPLTTSQRLVTEIPDTPRVVSKPTTQESAAADAVVGGETTVANADEMAQGAEGAIDEAADAAAKPFTEAALGGMGTPLEVGIFDDGLESVARWTGDVEPVILDSTTRINADFMGRLWGALEREVIPQTEKDAKKIRDTLAKQEDLDSQRAILGRASVPGKMKAFTTADGVSWSVDAKGVWKPVQRGRRDTYEQTMFVTQDVAERLQRALDETGDFVNRNGNLFGLNDSGRRVRVKSTDQPGEGMVSVSWNAGGTGLINSGNPVTSATDGVLDYMRASSAAVAEQARWADALASEIGPGMVRNHRQLLQALDGYGLASWYSEFLRSEGIDGLGNLLGGGKGFWYGFNEKADVFAARVSQAGQGAVKPLGKEMLENGAPVPGDLALVLDVTPEVASQIDSIGGTIRSLEDQIALAEQQMVRDTTQSYRYQDEIAQLTEQRDQFLDMHNALRAGQSPVTVSDATFISKGLVGMRGRVDTLERGLTQMTKRYGRGFDRRQKLLDILEEKQRRTATISEDVDAARLNVETLREMGGLRTSPDGKRYVQHDEFARMLFGGVTRVNAMGRASIRALAEMTDPERVWSLSNEKIPFDAINRLVSNAADETIELAEKEARVIEILGDYIGPGLQQKGQAVRAGIVDQVGNASLASEATNAPGRAKIMARGRNISNRWTRLQPGGLSVDLRNNENVVKGGTWYLDQFDAAMSKAMRAVGNTTVGGVGVLTQAPGKQAALPSVLELRKRVVGELIRDNGNAAGREARNRKVMTGMFDDLQQIVIDTMADMQGLARNDMGVEQIRNVTREAFTSFQDSLMNEARYWQEKIVDGADEPFILNSKGEPIPLPDAHIIAEYANGQMPLPDPEKFQQTIALTIGWAKSGMLHRVGEAKAKEMIDRAFSDTWRSLMLLRPAYIVRNIAEMSLRTHLYGHVSMLNSPLTFMAMAMGDPNGGRVKKMLSSLDKHDNTVMGTNFVKPGEADELLLTEEMRRYDEMMSSNISLSDIRGGRTTGAANLQAYVKPQHRMFNRGWAHELMMLQSTPETAFLMKYLTGRPSGNAALSDEAWKAAIIKDMRNNADFEQRFLAGGPHRANIWSDDVAMTNLMFDAQTSVLNRIKMYAGSEENGLWEFLASGKLPDPKNAGEYLKFAARRGGKAAAATQTYAIRGLKTKGDRILGLERQLGKYHDVIDPDALTKMKVKGYDSGVLTTQFQKVADSFFRVSSRIERVAVMGPEFRQAYADAAADLWKDMSRSTQIQVLENIGESTAKLKVGGVTVGKKHPLLKAAERSRGSRGTGTEVGKLDLDTVNAIAWQRAEEHVKNLFYDASDRQAGWHAMRLIMPFGQAWWNGISTVSELAAKNTKQTYKMLRAAHGLSGAQTTQAFPGTLVFGQQASEAPWFNENDGWLQSDEYGDKKLMVPGLGPLMGLATGGFGKLFGVDASPTMQTGWSLKNLNLVSGGEVPLPGLGPVGVLGAQIARGTIPGWDEFDGTEDGRTSFEQLLNKWAFPYGDFNSTNFPEALLPAYAQRTLAAVSGDELNRYNQRSFKPAMAWLANNNQYDFRTQQGKDDIDHDASVLARVLTGVDSLFQWLGPTSPNRTDFVKSADGTEFGLSAFSDMFYGQYMNEADGDYTKAVSDLLDDYGPNFLVILGGSSVGIARTSDKGWAKAAQYSDAWKSSDGADFFSVMFPGSRTSIAARNWQQVNGDARAKSTSERVDAVSRLLYEARKGQLEKRRDDQDWTDEQWKFEVDALDKEFAGVATDTTYQGGAGPGARIDEMNLWLNKEHSDLLAEAPAQAFNKAYELRRQMQARSEVIGAGVTSKAGTMLRVQYLRQLQAIDEAYPDSSGVLDWFADEAKARD